MINVFIEKNNLSNVAVNELLQLIQILLPNHNIITKTRETLRKLVKNKNIRVNNYCEKCGQKINRKCGNNECERFQLGINR